MNEVKEGREGEKEGIDGRSKDIEGQRGIREVDTL